MRPGRVAPSAADLLATARVLWPEPGRAELLSGRRGDGSNGRTREFLFLPDAARPRLLIPAGAPAVAATALRRYSTALAASERFSRAAAAAVVRTGLADRIFTDRLSVALPTSPTSNDSVEDVLGELLGREVIVSLGLGNRRANQKPVLQVLTPRGESVAFAKVGDSDVSRTLVRQEAHALAQAAALDLPSLQIPEVIGELVWRGLHLLVLTPLHTTARRRHGPNVVPATAMRELATSVGGVEPWVESAFWARLRSDVGSVLDDDVAARLHDRMDVLAEEHGGLDLGIGPWHGDWTPWNMSWERPRLALWDWERFDPAVPHGFDVLHHRLALTTWRGVTPTALDDFHQAAPDLLERQDVPRSRTSVVTSLYLLELTVRYCLAAQGPAGEPLRDRARWLVDALSPASTPATRPLPHSRRQDLR